MFFASLALGVISGAASCFFLYTVWTAFGTYDETSAYDESTLKAMWLQNVVSTAMCLFAGLGCMLVSVIGWGLSILMKTYSLQVRGLIDKQTGEHYGTTRSASPG